jgi:hypothetical protein
MSWKDNFRAKYGIEAYERRLARRREWGRQLPGGEKQRSQERRDANPEQSREYDRAWAERNPDKVKAKGREVSRKDGKYYAKKKIYKQTGISGERERVRMRDRYKYGKLMDLSGLEIHHIWKDGTAEYTGIALVEAKAHRRGKIKVIKVLEGEIELFSEADGIKQKCKNKGK